jgi:hypothetical protein
MYDNYIRALQALKNLLPAQAQSNFAVYEARLLENLHHEQMFGSTETLRSERAAIISGLNQLANNYGVTSFNALSYPGHAASASSTPRPSAMAAEPATGSPQTANTEIGSAELVVSGPQANININKASPQDFMAIFEYGFQKGGLAKNLEESLLDKKEQKESKSDKLARTTPPELKFTLLTSTIPTAYYHFLDVGSFPLVRILVDNTGPECDDATLTVSTVIEGYSDPSVKSFRVAKGKRREEVLFPLLKAPALKTLNNPQRATLHITVKQNAPVTAVLDEHTEPVRLLARNTALLGVKGPDGEIKDLTDFLAAWVTPYHPQIEKMLRTSADYHPDGEFVGYRPGNAYPDVADNVRAQARAIFQALKEQTDIRYSDPFASQGAAEDQITQRVRLPSQSLTIRSANCIEGSVLFASLLAAASIDPIIILITGHAFVGWRIDRNSPQYAFLEMTMIANESFAAAQQCAQELFEQARQAGDFARELFDPRGFARIIDIEQCRKEKGIYSLE